MSDFKHQIRFRLVAPDPAGGAYSAPPDSLAGLRGPTSKGRGAGWDEGREGVDRRGRGRVKGVGEGEEMEVGEWKGRWLDPLVPVVEIH